jgi:hypothetical protein
VPGSGWNDKLIADRQAILRPVHLELLFPFDEHHEFIRIVNEIRLDLPRRILPQTAGKSSGRPRGLDLHLVHHAVFDITPEHLPQQHVLKPLFAKFFPLPRCQVSDTLTY